MLRSSRPLRCDNLLVGFGQGGGGELTCKVADFGLAQQIQASRTHISMKGMAGTTPFIAPEVIDAASSKKRVAGKADVYSFAMTVLEAWTGQMPWLEQGMGDMKQVVLQVMQGRRPRIPESMPPELRELVVECWATSPEERPTFDMIRVSLERILRGLEPGGLGDQQLRAGIMRPGLDWPGVGDWIAQGRQVWQ